MACEINALLRALQTVYEFCSLDVLHLESPLDLHDAEFEILMGYAWVPAAGNGTYLGSKFRDRKSVV